jgi:hypothetical protein
MADASALGGSIDDLMAAVSSGNVAAAQEAIRQFNLNFTNQVASAYGYNTGVGTPAAPYAPTLPSQQATGGIGFIPNVTGYTSQPSLQEQGQQSDQSMQAAGLTGVYGAPQAPAAPVGSWIQADGGPQYGMQFGIMLPTGQIQRVGLAEATQMGFKPGQTPVTTMGIDKFVILGEAPPGPSSVTQTMAGQQNQQQLANTAVNGALGESQATGMYQAPHLAPPVGMAFDGSSFFNQPKDTQQTYLTTDRGDPTAAANHWVHDVNNAIADFAQKNGLPPPQYQGVYGPQSSPTETMQAQNQFFTQSGSLANQFGQYYAPLAPGQTAVAGVNAPQIGQQTEAAREAHANEAIGALGVAATAQNDPFRQMEVVYGTANSPGLQGLIKGITAGNGLPQFQAPNGTAQNTGVHGAASDLGNYWMNGAVGNTGLPNGATAPAPTFTSPGNANSVLNALKSPTDVIARTYATAPKDTQNMVTSAISANTGLSQDTIHNQIMSQLPKQGGPQFGTATI